MLALTLVTAATAVGDDVVDVIILAGQSNANGAGNVANLDEFLVEYATPNPNVRYCFWVNGQVISDEWRILAPRGGHSIGPEMMLGYTLMTAEPERDIAIMKVAWDGSSLVCDWGPEHCATGPGLELYDQLKIWMTLWRERIEDEGKTCRFAGLVWVQGESECRSEWQSDLYAGILDDFIEGIREHAENPDMPFAISLVNPRGGGYEYCDVVHGAMRQVATADTRIGTVTCMDLPLKIDDVHFTANSMIWLGGRLADTLIALDLFETNTWPEPGCDGDINGDGEVSSDDVLLMLANWGLCP